MDQKQEELPPIKNLIIEGCFVLQVRDELFVSGSQRNPLVTAKIIGVTALVFLVVALLGDGWKDAGLLFLGTAFGIFSGRHILVNLDSRVVPLPRE